MVAHDDGYICKWAEYANMQSMARPKKKSRGESPYIKCPKCKKEGRLNWAYDIHATKGERPFTFKYILVHERIPATQGKVRYIRCQSFTPEQRIAILKQVGRYIADPPKPHPKQRNLQLKEPGRDFEPQFQNQNEIKKGEENVRADVKPEQHGQIQHREPIFVPRGKRLTTCTRCDNPGYKYKTYFQHSNEPPIGPRRLRGIQDGWRYKRCSFTIGKVKKEKHNTNGKKGPAPEQTELGKSSGRGPAYISPFNCSICQNRIGNLISHTQEDAKEIYDILLSKKTGMTCMKCSGKYSLKEGFNEVQDELK
jgi:hypothetical protein